MDKDYLLKVEDLAVSFDTFAGEVQAVMASLVMMIAGAVNVLAAPWVRTLFF